MAVKKIENGHVKRVSVAFGNVRDVVKLIQKLAALLDYFNVSNNHIYTRSALRSPL